MPGQDRYTEIIERINTELLTNTTGTNQQPAFAPENETNTWDYALITGDEVTQERDVLTIGIDYAGLTENGALTTAAHDIVFRDHRTTFMCAAGCGTEMETFNYGLSVGNLKACFECSEKMFRWMLARSKTAVLNS